MKRLELGHREWSWRRNSRLVVAGTFSIADRTNIPFLVVEHVEVSVLDNV
jgi:hypothetical protein